MRILIAGGGTGGHVYPAISIAKSIKKLDPKAHIEFVGTSQGIESRVVPNEGFPLHLIEVGRLNKNVDWSERFWTLVLMPFALLKAALLVIKFRPHLVVGVGGYASGPALLMAALLGKKTVIWEPNAYPGLANRILAPFVSLSVVVFEKAAQGMRAREIKHMPMPVRPEVENAPARIATTADFCVLVFGGSQGARAINNVVSEALGQGGAWLQGVRFIHQTGRLDYEKLEEFYNNSAASKGHVDCVQYIDDMPTKYNWADLVICRAGTGTLSELAAMGKASILVPLPTAADDHQRKNAEVLSDAGAAQIVLQQDFTVDRLRELILDLKAHPEKVEAMEASVKQFHSENAAESLAKLLLGRIEHS